MVFIEPSGPVVVLIEPSGPVVVFIEPSGPVVVFIGPTGPVVVFIDPTGPVVVFIDQYSPHPHRGRSSRVSTQKPVLCTNKEAGKVHTHGKIVQSVAALVAEASQHFNKVTYCSTSEIFCFTYCRV